MEDMHVRKEYNYINSTYIQITKRMRAFLTGKKTFYDLEE